MKTPAKARQFRRETTLYLATSLLALALLSMSGCVGLTQASSSTAKSPSNSNASTALSISTQPRSETVPAGKSATFTVVAIGAGALNYQWKKSGIAISGATAASYTIPATTMAENLEVFTVVVNEGKETVTSRPAMLTVVGAPSALSSSQAALNFSSVNLGARKTLPVVFTNTGASHVTISNVTISGAGFTASGVQSGQILAPGQAATLNVTFDPAATGAHGGKVALTSDAADSSVDIALSGTGMQPPASHSATLGWAASTSTVMGYNVYRSTISGGPYTKLTEAAATTTQSIDSAVTSGQTYYYVVTSVESSGAESAYSNEVTAAIPNEE